MNTVPYIHDSQPKTDIFTFKENILQNIMTGFEKFQEYLREVLTETKNHSCDINENDANVACITLDIKALSDYLDKFSANLNKVLGSQNESYCLSNAIFCEIQNFIQYKTKSLKAVIPYKESTVGHADWWGRVFKQITQKIWALAEKATVALPGHHINKINTSLSPIKVLEKLTDLCAPCGTISPNLNLSLIKKMQILDCLDQLQLWKESTTSPNNTSIENTKKWISAFANTIIIKMHHTIIDNLYSDLIFEKSMKIPTRLLDCLRDLKNAVHTVLETTIPFSPIARIQKLFVLLDKRIHTLNNRHDENGKIKKDIFENLRKTLLNIIKVFNAQSSHHLVPLTLYTTLQNLISECLKQNKQILFSNRNVLWKTGKIFKNTFYTAITGFMYPCYNWYTTRRCFFPTTSSHTAHAINMLLLEIIAEVHRNESVAREKANL